MKVTALSFFDASMLFPYRFLSSDIDVASFDPSILFSPSPRFILALLCPSTPEYSSGKRRYRFAYAFSLAQHMRGVAECCLTNNNHHPKIVTYLTSRMSIAVRAVS